MTYAHTIEGTFLRRPNRFLAHVLTASGEEVVCHVKNTGRLKELFVPGASVILEFHPDAAALGRKTAYSLIGIYKEHAGCDGNRQLVNIDSQAPNRAAFDWVSSGALAPGVNEIKREVVYGNSRFDLAFQEPERLSFMEVKGVTLEFDGLAMFPDAPTERGVKHILELKSAVKAGYGAYLLFVIQMKGITAFTPNRNTHAEFADALRAAKDAGVRILARNCIVTKDSMLIDQAVEVRV